MMSTTYEEAVAYLLSIPKFAAKTTHENLRGYLTALGNPQDSISCIHVAGTNGKGSVCTYLAEMFREAGQNVGVFTSPHLVRINERFRINGSMIDDRTFVQVFDRVKTVVEEGMRNGLVHPNFFEYLFLMAACWFREEAVDRVIWETGMGGRLDATNVVQPEITVITSIGMDHMQYLGDTLEKIAGEKAGILKPGIPCVYRSAEDGSAEVIRQRGKTLGCPLLPVEPTQIIIDKVGEDVIDFSYGTRYDNTYSIRKTALYQLENAALAIETAGRLGLSETVIHRGLRRMNWPGRMEELEPGIYVDGAHNEPAIEAFCKTVSTLYADKKIVLLFAVASDKQYNKMISTLCKTLQYEKIIVTAIAGGRVTPPEQVAELFRRYTRTPVSVEPDNHKALIQARACVSEDCRAFCVGSLYLVGSLEAQEGA
ncbi:MAG: bifunctional folylpolyglutamate synthase/dihydrofolate synthase [Clostridium sp.]|nr:bifunctional folylpolyglutamate synthase/dihydrofolate synthase [Clostridium sp.]